MIGRSFYEKSELEQYLRPNTITVADYNELLEQLYETFLSHNISFVVTDTAGEMIGVSFNSDLDVDLKIEMKETNQLTKVLELVDYVESETIK